MTLSVIVITKNEALMIGRCLASVSWADEIIVVDSGSTDGTQALCRTFTPHVIDADWPGFGAQKNRALKLATAEWVLSLDADEYLTPASQDEIRAAITAPSLYSAYRLPRRSSYCGRFLRHGGWYPDYVIRLFRRNGAHFSEDLVHERVVTKGRIGTLHHPLCHETYRDLEEVVDKVNTYSTAGAAMAVARHKRISFAGTIGRAAWSFIRTYLLRGSILDGVEGLMLAISTAEVTYYKYAKLYLANKRSHEND